MKRYFNDRYISGDIPWNLERPDFNLVAAVRDNGVDPGKAVDIGCGTGDNALWLAHQGFTTTGIDISARAIEMALEKSEKNNLHADFYVRNILKEEIPGKPFKFAFDRGCFHTFRLKSQRKQFARKVASLLDEGGQWLSLVGSVDDGRLDIGPPKRTAGELISAVEPYFEILLLKKGLFDSNSEKPSKIWICLMRKR